MLASARDAKRLRPVSNETGLLMVKPEAEAIAVYLMTSPMRTSNMGELPVVKSRLARDF